MKKLIFMGVLGLFLLGSCNSKSEHDHEGHSHETEKAHNHDLEGHDHEHEEHDHANEVGGQAVLGRQAFILLTERHG